MKRLLTSAALFLCCIATSFAQFSGSGAGTENDPYLIYNENQLAQVANFLDQDGVVFKLQKDLDVTSYIQENSPSQGWLPIGVQSSPFKGKFYGNNHTISGLFINRSSTNHLGFFGYVSGATIENLKLKATKIVGESSDYVGTLAGYVTGSTVTGCSVEVTSGGVKGKNFVGALFGFASSSTVSNCSTDVANGNNGGVSGTNYVGGFAGKSSSTVFNGLIHSGDVTAQNQTGGLIGATDGGSITDATQTGNVSGSVSVGGIIGQINNSFKLTNITYKGNVVGSANVGGIAGELASGSDATFISVFSKGEITNHGDYTGGIVGKSNGNCIPEMSNSSHFGDINGNNYVGGLVGAILNTTTKPTLHTWYLSKSSTTNSKYQGPFYDTVVSGSKKEYPINNCVAIGNVTGTNNVGGLIGCSQVADAYTSSSSKASTTDYYIWCDGVYTGNNGYGYVYTTTYTRNTASTVVYNCFYSGNLQGATNVGGLAGTKEGGEIKYCYTNAFISGTSCVGGITGVASGSIVDGSIVQLTLKSNVAINTMISASSDNLGRIYGKLSDNQVSIGALGSAEGNRALTQTSVILCGVAQDVVDDLQNGTSVGPSMLKLKGNYVSWGWNFDENWNILETECYPYKKYQAAPPVIESNLVSQATSISGQSLNGGTVYLYYKDREAVSTQCDGHQWSFPMDALQSGAQVQIYADVEGMTPSYLSMTTVGYPGSGTEDDPWRIYTAEDLQGATKSGYFKLMNDINLSEWINENSPEKGWPAIGRNSTAATYINGDGHKVTGLWINTTEGYNGLFSNYSAGYIKNLTVEVAQGKSVKGGDYTGILIGRMTNSQIVNCSVKGTVEGTDHVGALSGYVENSTLTSNTADGEVTATAANAYAGGLVGQTVKVEMNGCNANTTLAAEGASSFVGGLVGRMDDGNLTRSYANNVLTAKGTGSYVGGLVGYSNSPITQSFSTGTVKATGTDSYAGGLVGYATATVADSYSTANTQGTTITAGLVAQTTSTIDKCYAKGDVVGVYYGAGVVGKLDGPGAALTNSIALNNIVSLSAQSAWGCRVINGWPNGAAEPDNSNYALNTMQVSVNGVAQKKTDDPVEGIAKTAAELMASETYLGIGWDLTDTWGVDEGQMYPYLLWEVDVNPVADVSLDKTTLLLAVGKSETLTATVMPLGATNKRLSWTTSNAAVATVDDGVVAAIATGEATITATSTDGSNLSATCKVTVVANHDAAIAELQSLVDRAQALYDNSTEGENIGQYAAGARAQLKTVIDNVKKQMSSTMDESAIASCTNALNQAIDTFKSRQVTAGDDTDISLLDNTIYLERVEAAAGSQVRLSVKMKNTIDVQGYQFDLYLPEGVTIATDEDGFAMAELSTARTTAKKTDYFNSSPQADGGFRVLCGSSKGYTFSGNDGEVAVITLNIAQDIAEGEHPIILKTVKLSDTNSVPYATDYLKSTLVISSYTLGDVNADGSIDVADFIAVANYILGKSPAGFVEKAADINEDGSIDVADFIGVANIILHSTSASRSGMPAAARAPRKSPTNVDELQDVIYVEPITAASGTQAVLSVRMKNSNAVAGYEFSLQLPEGVTVATDEDDFLMAEMSEERTTSRKTDYFNAALQDDGTLKVLCGSSTADPSTGKPYAISGNDGEVARITVNIPSGYAIGDYAIFIKNGILADPDAVKTVLPTEVESTLTVEENDDRTVLDENSTTEPDPETNANVRVKRTITAGQWNTICLPFSMTEAQCKEAFGSDVQLGNFTGCETTEDEDENIIGITVKFETATAIEANHPYIIKVSAPVTEFTVDGADIEVEEEPSVDCDRIGKGTKKDPYLYNSFVGTYVAQTEVPSQSLFLSGNKFWYSTGQTKMKGYRAYFDFYDVLTEVEEAYSSHIAMTFDLNDGPTGVKNIEDRRVGNENAVFDLSGRRVSSANVQLRKGIYVKDGKKVVFK